MILLMASHQGHVPQLSNLAVMVGRGHAPQLSNLAVLVERERVPLLAICNPQQCSIQVL